MHQATPRYYHVTVRPAPERVGQVQRIMAAHLRYWGLERLTPSTTRGLGLLMELAVQGSPDARIEIEAWWNGQQLINAVSYEAPVGVPAHELPLRCSQIAEMSDGWGSCTRRAQHLVWFALRSRIDDHEVLVAKRPAPTASEALGVPRAVLSRPGTDGVPARAGAAS
ncbi:pep a2 [Streptomyces sp. cg28]|uniref:pep a2 n=1 Tax=Streptomyces sp. cg28 TaxID=3403457 RepID=UPI003B219DCC